MSTRAPFPPFTRETAIQKVRLAEDGWNTRDAEQVALAYSLDSRWRNRSEFVNGKTGHHRFFNAQVGERAGIPVDQRALGFHGQSHRRALCLRVAR
jgi:nuclear transport factor 2 (NTF2) superfamily protein